MGAATKEKTRPNRLDPATWIPRKEAARILKVSLPTILSWAGPRFRVEQVTTRSRIKWFVHAADVERVRLQRLGPTAHELESFVLAELAAGRTASEIVRAGHQITLGDVEVFENWTRLSGGFLVDARTTLELRQLIGAEAMNGSGGARARASSREMYRDTHRALERRPDSVRRVNRERRSIASSLDVRRWWRWTARMWER